ncbi:hypothetical protein NDU88_006702 [Pleurodeles waltl]|uniref:Uncharacterized protein n=1 Tax=Pleurodeles waltl TaxID=8319 RepID=A0AAV7VRR2_PLEWA|nr:hypothetical protein NDU88_006702 [Pleurodeles waltl]
MVTTTTDALRDLGHESQCCEAPGSTLEWLHAPRRDIETRQTVIRTGRIGHCGSPLICVRAGSNDDRRAEGIGPQGAHIGAQTAQQGTHGAGSVRPQGAVVSKHKLEWAHRTRSPAEEGPRMLLATTLGPIGSERHSQRLTCGGGGST